METFNLLNQWTIFICALMSCVAYLGALLITSEADNEEALAVDFEAEAEEDYSELKQMYKECTVLLKNPKDVLTALANSCSFSIMVYFFLSLIGPNYKKRGRLKFQFHYNFLCSKCPFSSPIGFPWRLYNLPLS